MPTRAVALRGLTPEPVKEPSKGTARDARGRITRLDPDDPSSQRPYISAAGLECIGHGGAAVCQHEGCAKDMPHIWDAICHGCHRAFCYDHVQAWKGLWMCASCRRDLQEDGQTRPVAPASTRVLVRHVADGQLIEVGSARGLLKPDDASVFVETGVASAPPAQGCARWIDNVQGAHLYTASDGRQLCFECRFECRFELEPILSPEPILSYEQIVVLQHELMEKLRKSMAEFRPERGIRARLRKALGL